MKEAPGDLDWVTKRNTCSVRDVFERLSLGVMDDVNKRQELREQHNEFGFIYGFRFNRKGEQFSVARHTPDKGIAVVFALRGPEIVVIDEQNKVYFSARVTLNNQGDCVLLVDKEELHEWQFRKKALDALFFPD
jgi:hypothetical protein